MSRRLLELARELDTTPFAVVLACLLGASPSLVAPPAHPAPKTPAPAPYPRPSS